MKHLFESLLLIVVLLSFSLLSVVTVADEVIKAPLYGRFMMWMAEHGKTYETSHEFNWRYELFSEVDVQLKAAIAHGYVKESTVGHNKFSDLLPEELGGRPTNFLSSKPSSPLVPTNDATSGYQTIVDWCVANEACNDIQDQGETCTASGGAFATIAAMEAQTVLQYGGALQKFSE